MEHFTIFCPKQDGNPGFVPSNAPNHSDAWNSPGRQAGLTGVRILVLHLEFLFRLDGVGTGRLSGIQNLLQTRLYRVQVRRAVPQRLPSTQQEATGSLHGAKFSRNQHSPRWSSPPTFVEPEASSLCLRKQPAAWSLFRDI